MPHAKREWRDWATRFREECRRRELSLAQVAERLEMAESTVRSWTNGNREINLSDFFRLCAAAETDPKAILFTEEPAEKVPTINGKLDILARAWQMIRNLAATAFSRCADGLPAGVVPFLRAK